MLTRFISNARGNVRYPVSEITRIIAAERRESGIAYYDVKLIGDVEILVAGYELDRVLDPMEHRIPAKDGYAVLHIDEDGDGEIYREPVIAWGFTQQGEVVPITVSGENDDMYRRVPFELPDGRIRVPEDDATYRDLDGYREVLRRRHGEKSKGSAQ